MIFLFNGGDCSSFLKVHPKRIRKKDNQSADGKSRSQHFGCVESFVSMWGSQVVHSKPQGCAKVRITFRESETTTLPERGLMFMRLKWLRGLRKNKQLKNPKMEGIVEWRWFQYTLPETNISNIVPKNRPGPKRKFHLPTINFRGGEDVSFREGIQCEFWGCLARPSAYVWSQGIRRG